MHLVKGVTLCLLACDTARGMPQPYARRLDSDDDPSRDDITPAVKPRFVPLIGAGVAAIVGLLGAGTAIGIGSIGLTGKGWGRPKFPFGRHGHHDPFGPKPQPQPQPQTQTQQQTQQQTSQPPQTQTQTVTQPPPIQVTSTPTPTTQATSSSSTTSSCTICLACEDDELPEPELPPPEVWHPWPEEISPDILASLAAFMTATAAAEETPAPKLAKRSTERDFTVCGITATAPIYTGWSETAEKSRNWKKYGYSMNDQCPNYRWGLLDGANAPTKKRGKAVKYATEHIYEIFLIREFFLWRLYQDDIKKFTLAEHKTDKPCLPIFAPLFIKPPTWAPQHYAGPKPLLQRLADQLSGDHRNDELVYLDQTLNNLKHKVLAESSFLPYHDYKKNLVRAARLNLVQLYMRDQHVSDVWKKVSERIYQFYVNLDNAMASSTAPAIVDISTKLGSLKWAYDYRRWEKEHLEKVAKNVNTSITTYLTSAKAQIKAAGSAQNSQLKALEAEILAREGPTDTIARGRGFENSLLP
ncbi:hypothetical protein QBC35DRAFT_207734 [Podospora australis]|uniref:Uncharacterized protein n=1 Tax=Podospora australis TaxID=1536484 RepID=A0AAN6WVT6_9PEZI|nr:hypothetical protein QBC35DRAFT_207734 [Podospora australis]